MKRSLLFAFIATLIFTIAGMAQQGKWEPTFNSIVNHRAPEWLHDAKLGIQFVGSQKEFDDYTYWHWAVDEQMRRRLGYKSATNKEFESFSKEKMYSTGQLKMEYQLKTKSDKDTIDYDEMMEVYKRTGAKYIVSTLVGCFPGTEGLEMTDKEVAAARKHGFKVGIHYNLLGTGHVPAIGHPGFVEFSHNKLKDEVNRIDADFIFFDGDQRNSSYLKTPEIVSWYYNYADRKNKEVWVNDDLGKDIKEGWKYGDVYDGEGYTMSGVVPKAWVNWDHLRNQWNCWVNAYGVNMLHGGKHKWEYRRTEDILLFFIDAVAKGGGRLVQMSNTKKAWEIMWEIGDWLAVNGEAIYSTRAYFDPDPFIEKLPSRKELDTKGKKSNLPYRFRVAVEMAKETGPLYYTKKGGYLYVIHWGWPDDDLKIPKVRAQKSSAIRMLGVDQDLSWKQEGDSVVIKIPELDKQPCKYAYSFKIKLADK